MNDKITTLLGFARKAGKVACGSSASEKLIKSRKCALVLLAKDAAQNTKDRFLRLCSQADIPCLQQMSMQELGKAVGMDDKAVIAISDAEFAKSITKSSVAE